MSKLVHFSHLGISVKMLSHGKWVLAFSAIHRKSHFHFLTIVELAPFQVLVQQPSGIDAQKFAVNGLQELFLSDVCPLWLYWHPEWSHLIIGWDYWSNAGEAVFCTWMRKWDWLFVCELQVQEVHLYYDKILKLVPRW